MNEGKDYGVGESDAPSAHPREAKAWTGYAFQQRTDERSIRSFIGLCAVTPGIHTGGQAAGLPTSFSFFFFQIKKKDTVPLFERIFEKIPFSNKNLSVRKQNVKQKFTVLF